MRKKTGLVLRWAGGGGELIIGTDTYPIYMSGCLYIGKGKGFAGQVSEDMGWGTRDTIREPGVVIGDGDDDGDDNDDARYHQRSFKALRYRHRRARTKIEFQKKKREKKKKKGNGDRCPPPLPTKTPLKSLP